MLIHKTMVLISLFYCCENVFTHMDDWEDKDFYSHVNMEDITGADYTYAKKKFAKILKKKI